MTARALPSARDEAWRYSDLKALARAHALPPANDRPVAVRALLLHDGERLELRATGDGRAQEEAFALLVPAGAHATLVETLDGAGWIDRRLDVRVEAGATLTHIIRQCSSVEAVVTLSSAIGLAADARYRGVVLNMGGSLGRLELLVALEGAEADAQFDAAQLGRGRQTLEIVTRVEHRQPGATSRQRVRSVLTDQATGSYLGKIKVSRDAQGTDAEQSSRALLLARTATANTKPELEIYADDVKCAHGATVGELDRAALFYLESRGLDPATARALLIEAFVADVVEAVDDVELRGLIEADTAGWLADALETGR